MAQHPNLNPGNAPVTKLSVTVREDVTLDQLKALLATITRVHGCLTCGILGMAVELAGDPPARQELLSVPGVTSVTIS